MSHGELVPLRRCSECGDVTMVAALDVLLRHGGIAQVFFRGRFGVKFGVLLSPSELEVSELRGQNGHPAANGSSIALCPWMFSSLPIRIREEELKLCSLDLFPVFGWRHAHLLCDALLQAVGPRLCA